MPLVTIKVFEDELSNSQAERPDSQGHGGSDPVCRREAAG